MSQPIAFCITTLLPGGAERQFAELILRLPTEEFEPRVVVLAGRPREGECGLVERLTSHDVPVTFLNARGIQNAASVLLRLKRELRRIRPALVQSFLAHANVASALAARAAGVRPIVTGIRVAERRSNLHAWLARRSERWVARHVCVSHSVAEFAIREMQLDPRKVTVIPNGVDMAVFAHAEPLERGALGLPTTARVLLHIGRLDTQKRIDWLIERFTEALPQLPETYLLLAGSGPSQVQLANLAAELGIADRVRFLGWRNDVPRLMATCDALVLTSAWEGMPNVVLEAMAAARPVLVTEVEGVREILGNSATEQMTPREDRAAFVERLVLLLSDKGLLKGLAAANQERAQRKFALQATSQSYVDLYRELLQ